MNYKVVISTINRDMNQYLYETIDSYLLNSSPNFMKPILVVGNNETEYIKHVQSSIDYVIPMTSELWSWVENKGKCEKFNLNFLRCLTSCNDNILYLEDDITFKPLWDVELSIYLSQIKDKDFVLSIYTPYDLSHHKENIVKFDKGFYGTQGVYFSKGIKDKFAEKIIKEGILDYKHMADLLLQEFCNENNIPLYVLKTSLIQHIGEVSSIHNNSFHKSVS